MSTGVENLKTKREMCELLKISDSTLQKYYQKEGMPFIQLGKFPRFEPDKVLEWLRNRNQKKVK